MNVNRLRDWLKKDEGKRFKPYKDSRGFLTIGYGRWLEGGISEDEAELMLNNDMRTAYEGAQKAVKSFHLLNDDRQEILVNMVFNLGLSRFKKFKKMLAAIEKGDHKTVPKEMLDSLWAKQVKGRAQRLAKRWNIKG